MQCWAGLDASAELRQPQNPATKGKSNDCQETLLVHSSTSLNRRARDSSTQAISECTADPLVCTEAQTSTAGKSCVLVGDKQWDLPSAELFLP